jgi:Spy/CpxP family protein refolding chaperone
MKFSRSIHNLLVPGILAAATLSLAAQTTTAPQTAPHRPANAGGGGQGAGASGFALGGPVGALTDQQRASYEAALNRVRGNLNELQTQLRAARQDFVVTSLDQKFDENVLRQKALVAAKIEAEMAVLRAKAMSQVQPPLTPEQIEKVKGAQPGQMQQLRRQQMERQGQHAPASGNTNQDATGLPPKK